jgi:hypothetical protein
MYRNFRYQYFLKIVPTTFESLADRIETNQFRSPLSSSL